MSNKTMKTLTIGDNTYEIVDEQARRDIGSKMNTSELPTAITTALAQAKASGEFNGKTPVRGTDYWTDSDKAEIKSYVDNAILGGAW